MSSLEQMPSSLTTAQKKAKAARNARAKARTTRTLSTSKPMVSARTLRARARTTRKQTAERKRRMQALKSNEDRKLQFKLNDKLDMKKRLLSDLFFLKSFGTKNEVSRTYEKIGTVQKEIKKLQVLLRMNRNDYARRPTSGGLGLTTAHGFYNF
jgi:hypothetical protein